jgi:signal transduction histidine kinase
MQELSLDRHLYLKTIRPEGILEAARLSSNRLPSLSSNIQAVCQRQVEELLGQFPLLGAWMVYRDRPDPLGERHRVGVVCETRSGFDPMMVSQLESELWRYESSDRRSAKIFQTIYFYPLLSTSQSPLPLHLLNTESLNKNQNLDEYLLLWATHPLSSYQQKFISERLKLVNDYLVVDREKSLAIEKVHLLEQTIGRSEHQLRNYLGMLNLYAQNINLSLSDPALKEQATVISNTVSEISQHLNKLLSCSSSPKHQAEPQDFRKCFASILEVLGFPITEKKIKINWPSHQYLEFEFDSWGLKQAFTNFLSNAIAFSYRGGTINLQWQEFRTEVLIKVSDRGPGFSPEDIKNAFTPYYSKRPGGTGLGLAIAKKIILDHHGSIWLENLPEGGAQVSVILPRYAR